MTVGVWHRASSMPERGPHDVLGGCGRSGTVRHDGRQKPQVTWRGSRSVLEVDGDLVPAGAVGGAPNPRTIVGEGLRPEAAGHVSASSRPRRPDPLTNGNGTEGQPWRQRVWGKERSGKPALGTG